MGAYQASFELSAQSTSRPHSSIARKWTNSIPPRSPITVRLMRGFAATPRGKNTESRLKTNSIVYKPRLGHEASPDAP
jgi:hypothetical protein